MHPLISVLDLHARLGDVTVLDVRWQAGRDDGRAGFEAGHVPGAVFVDLDADLAGRTRDEGAGRHPLPTPADLQAAMRRAGVRESRPVVVYDDWSGRAAARAWWLLRWAGKDDVRLLDGGWSAWSQWGGPVETGQAHPEPGDLVVRPGAMPVVDARQVAAFEGTLVDARATERFRGDLEPLDPVAGHVPGAVNVPTETNLGAEGRFRPADQIAALYAAAGVDGSGPVAAYCGSGVTACHDVLALEVAGVRAALYPGSWSAWSSDASRPVETGA